MSNTTHNKEVHEAAPVVQGEHEMNETITFKIYHADHGERQTKLFNKTKHHLINVLDTPCFICGSKEQREIHHYLIEFADENSADWDDKPWDETLETGEVIHHKTGKMREAYPDFDWANFKEPTDFVDSERNMLVLCKRHHTGRNHGIHYLPYPIWIMQKYRKQGFIFSPDEIKDEVKH